jgi:hypothetical protein
MSCHTGRTARKKKSSDTIKAQQQPDLMRKYIAQAEELSGSRHHHTSAAESALNAIRQLSCARYIRQGRPARLPTLGKTSALRGSANYATVAQSRPFMVALAGIEEHVAGQRAGNQRQIIMFLHSRSVEGHRRQQKADDTMDLQCGCSLIPS